MAQKHICCRSIPHSYTALYLFTAQTADVLVRTVKGRFTCQTKAKYNPLIWNLWATGPGWMYEKRRPCNLFTVTRFLCVTPGKGGVNYINPKQINVWQPLKGCGKWLEIEPTFESPNLKLWWFLLDSETENTDWISNWNWTGPFWLSLSLTLSSSQYFSFLSSSVPCFLSFWFTTSFWLFLFHFSSLSLSLSLRSISLVSSLFDVSLSKFYFLKHVEDTNEYSIY